MPFLPKPGDKNWGGALNKWLLTARNSDGTLKGVQNFINVKDFGAMGDGNSSFPTDDTAAIQATIDFVAQRGRGGLILFPSGTYLIGGKITLLNSSSLNYNGISLVGEGFAIPGTNQLSGTELLFSGAAGPLIECKGGGSASIFSQFSVRGMDFHASNANLVGPLMRLDWVGNIDFCRCLFRAEGAGTLIDGDQWINIQFSSCNFFKAKVGIQMVPLNSSKHYANVVRFEKVWFQALEVASDFSEFGRSLMFDHCVFEPGPNRIASTNYTGVHDTTFSHCWFGDANLAGTWIIAGSKGGGNTGRLRVIDSEVASADIGIDVVNAFHVEIQSNTLAAGTAAVRMRASNLRHSRMINNRVVMPASNGIAFDIQNGVSHTIYENSVVRGSTSAGGYAQNISAYQLSVGTGGRLRDTNPWELNGGSQIINYAGSNWLIQSSIGN
jgi:hypothetical protein